MKKKIGIFLIIVVAIGLVYLRPEKKEKDPFFVEKKTKTEKVNVLRLEESINRLETTKFAIYKDNILKWENGKLHIRSLSKEGQSYSLALNANDPIIVPGNDYIFFANKEDGIIYYIDEKAEMKERIPLGKPIYSMKEFKDHLVYHSKDGDREELGVINPRGQNLMRYEYKGENILSYSYDPKKNNLTVAVLQVYDKGLTSRLEFYKKLEAKGQHEFLNFEGEVIVRLEYSNLGNIVALTDDNLYYISEAEIVWNKDINITRDVYLDSGDIYLLHSNYLSIIDSRGRVRKEIGLDDEYSHIIHQKSGLVKDASFIYNDKGLSILKDGEEFLRQKQPIQSLDVYKDRVFILDRDKYGLYKLDKEEREIKEGD